MFLCEHGNRTGSVQRGFFSTHQWFLVKDACTGLSPFEEATNMVSTDNACIRATLRLVFLLQHTPRVIMVKVLEAKQLVDEDFLASQGYLYPEFTMES